MEQLVHRVSLYKTKDFKEMRRLVACGAYLQTFEDEPVGLTRIAVFEDATLCEAINEKHRRGTLKICSRDFDLADDEVKTALHTY